MDSLEISDRELENMEMTLAMLYHNAFPDLSIFTENTISHQNPELVRSMARDKLTEALVNIHYLLRLEIESKSESRLPVFSNCGFGIKIVQDALFFLRSLVDAEESERVMIKNLYYAIRNYLELCLQFNLRTDDFFRYSRDSMALCGLLEIGAEIDINTQMINIFKTGDYRYEIEFYEGVLEELSELLDECESPKILVQRIFDGTPISIMASDEDVYFIIGEESDLNENRYDDRYISDQIYRNDKAAPINKEEWISIMTPESGVLLLGKMTYSSLEEAQDGEAEFMNTLMASIDE